MREINQAGIDLIKEFEGFRSVAYRDPVGIYTIGYGHTKTAHRGMQITLEAGEHLLRSDLSDAIEAVERYVDVDLNDNEFAALVSFAFNLGGGNLRRSTLLRKLNMNDRAGAADEFLRWNRAGGRVLQGLVRRREAERELFLTGEDDVSANP